jgi:hypothetical protein
MYFFGLVLILIFLYKNLGSWNQCYYYKFHVFVLDIAVSKNTSLPPLWSPEAERSHSLSQHTTTSSKKPAFNLSAFGTLSPVSTSRIGFNHISFKYFCLSSIAVFLCSHLGILLFLKQVSWEILLFILERRRMVGQQLP